MGRINDESITLSATYPCASVKSVVKRLLLTESEGLPRLARLSARLRSKSLSFETNALVGLPLKFVSRSSDRFENADCSAKIPSVVGRKFLHHFQRGTVEWLMTPHRRSLFTMFISR